jgi:glucose-1-phosphate thymidylyltransferase
MIFYPINTLIRSGVEDILIISSKQHSGPIIENLGDGWNFEANFTYKVQDVAHVPLGIASALKLAKDFTRDEAFAVILGDNFYEDCFPEEFKHFEQMNYLEAAIFLKQVTDPKRFGVALVEESGPMTRVWIEEKPKEPKSNWAVTGLYLYKSLVYEIAEKFDVSARGELEITDINNHYCERGFIDVNYLNGFWGDMGVPESMAKTQRFIEQDGFRMNYRYDEQ